MSWRLAHAGNILRGPGVRLNMGPVSLRAAGVWFLQAVYWAYHYWLLFRHIGIPEDGHGLMPSFHWSLDPGRSLLCTRQQYESMRAVWLELQLPFWIASALLSSMGLLVVRNVLRSGASSRGSAFRRAASSYLCAALAILLISDAGIHWRWWFGPLQLIGTGWYDRLLVSRILVAGALATGGIAALLFPKAMTPEALHAPPGPFFLQR